MNRRQQYRWARHHADGWAKQKGIGWLRRQFWCRNLAKEFVREHIGSKHIRTITCQMTHKFDKLLTERFNEWPKRAA